MNDNRLWDLIARKLSGEANEEELQELEEICRIDEDLNDIVQTLTDYWHESVPLTDLDSARLFEDVREKLKQKEQQKPAAKKGSLIQWLRSKSKVPKMGLLAHQIKMAWRHITRERAFSIINIGGLAIGMASALLILLWIQDELSFDSFHTNKNRIYQVYSRGEYEGKVEAWGGTSMLLAPELDAHYPEVAVSTRINPVAAFIFHAADKHLSANGLLTDPGFLQIFDFPLLQGDKNKALNAPRNVVITETFARKLFGSSDAMGKMVGIDSNANFMVTGVLKALPNNTQFQFDYLLPWSYRKEVHWDRPSWGNTDIRTCVLLQPGVSEAKANARIAKIVQAHAPETKIDLMLHPMTKWRLWSEFENGVAAGGYIHTVRLFGLIAVVILLIACINYTNLSTAQSEKRAREVGIRKVAGAAKSALIRQFIGESIIVALLAGIIALQLVQPSLGWFNELTGKHLTIPFAKPVFWGSFLGFIGFTGLVAGIYPALYLSGFKPIKVLKGSFKAANALVTPRKVMVVVQFTVAIVLMICTIVIHDQIRYGQRRDAGYDQEQLAFVYLKGDMLKKFNAIQAELRSSRAITSLTRTNSPITSIWNVDGSFDWPGKKAGLEIGFVQYHTDKDFAQTMGLTLVAGRDIDAEKYPTDSTAILLSATAARIMGFKDPIGQQVKSQEGSWQIVGVVKDFIPESPFGQIAPIVIQGPGKQHWYGTLSFKLNPQQNTRANLDKIGAILKKYNPDYPFEYYFADEAYAIRFTEEEKSGTLAGIFTALTIFISCLGLFALAAYTAESRTKEIGVRKVLGASVVAISGLLSKDFLKLVLLSFVIASPIAWWAMHSWLQQYAYRINISIWVFVLTGLVSIGIAILTVSVQAIRAAIANPVKALRTE